MLLGQLSNNLHLVDVYEECNDDILAHTRTKNVENVDKRENQHASSQRHVQVADNREGIRHKDLFVVSSCCAS